MIDIKQLTQQKNDLKTLWDYFAIAAEFPDKEMRLWLLDYPKDMIESAIKVLAVKEDRVDEPVKFLAGVLRKSKERNMTPEEREEQISTMRAMAARVKAHKAFAAKVKAEKEAFAKVLLEHADICTDLQPVADGLHDFGGRDCDGVGVGVGVGVSVSLSEKETTNETANETEKSKAAASPLTPLSEKKNGKATPKPEPTPTSAVRASSANLEAKATPKPKTLKTARGVLLKPEGFDSWSNVERTEWINCTCDADWDFGEAHRPSCAVKPQVESKAAAASAETYGIRDREGNLLGVDEL